MGIGHNVNIFAQLPEVHIGRSVFDRSSDLTTAFDASYLYPMYCEEVYPGDTFKVDASLFARLSTPVVPILDNIYCDTFWFYVPNRLVWSNWQRFNGEQDNPTDSTDYLVPQIVIPNSGTGDNAGFPLESIFDYFGLPVCVKGDGTASVNALPLRMYNKIFNDWFRDENLQNSLTVNLGDGPDPVTDYSLMRRNKKKDYFTSCMPQPQKGDGVSISLGGSANVYGNGILRFRPANDNTAPITLTPGTAQDNASFFNIQSQTGSGMLFNSGVQLAGLTGSGASGADQLSVVSKGVAQQLNVGSGLYADLGAVDPITITTLRYASILQKFREKNQRGGTRYIEMIRNHFGVTSPDARLQRSEFLGSTSSLMNINPVAQTSSSDSVSPQGNLSAYGVMASNGIGFRRSFTEHGFVIGLVMVRTDLAYQQGLHKMWTRRQLVDYYFPLFNGLSEQGVLNQEIMFTGTSSDKQVFGYQERFSELRYKQSLITGKMRSVASTSLDVWHTAQYFATLPTLNTDFIQDGTKEVLQRVLAVQNEPQIIFNAYFNEKDTRPMPVHSIPGLGANL